MLHPATGGRQQTGAGDRAQPGAQQSLGRSRADEPCVDDVRGEQSDSVDCKQQTERLRTEAEDVLVHERRRGDVGEEAGERQRAGRDDAAIARAVEKVAISRERAADRAGVARGGRKRLVGDQHCRGEQDDADHRLRGKDSAPRRDQEDCAAESRGQDRRQGDDRAERRVEPRGVDARIHVAHHRSSDDDPGGSRDPLKQTQDIEHADRRRRCTAERRADVEDQTSDQGPAAAECVAQRPDEQLTDGDPDHAHRQCYLDARRRHAEIPSKARQRGQIQVGCHRRECGQTREHDHQTQRPGTPMRLGTAMIQFVRSR